MLAYFVGSVTQGAADAFASAEIPTALSGQTGKAARIREVIFEWAAQSPTAAGSQYDVVISRREQASQPIITDRNVISKWKQVAGYITSGMYVMEYLRRLTFTEDDNLLVVEDPLTLCIDTSNTTAANTVYCRIGYELVNVNANDRLAIALQSLNDAG